MHRRTALAGLAALTLAACAATDLSPLSDDEAANLSIARIEVVATSTAFETEAARELSNFLAADLTSALRREFADRTGSTGWRMQAQVTALRLGSGTATTVGTDRSTMSGTLLLIDGAGTVRATVPLTVTAGAQATTVRGAAMGVLFGRQGRYYRTLLDAFAAEGRQRLLGRELPGQRMVRRTMT